MRLEVYQQLMQQGAIPLFYHADAAVAVEIVGACARGGARAIEFTNRGPFAHEVFAHIRRAIWRNFPDLLLGIGSVQDAATAALYLQLGADFVVTPLLREDVVRLCHRRKVAVIPGAMTPSEIGLAEEWGCELVKLSPADVVGPAFLKAHLAPCPWTRALVSGGVSPQEANLRAWFEAGAACVGLGSRLISDDLLQQQQWDALAQRVSAVLALVKRLRSV